MANRFPLTLNTTDKQIEELPSGVNLDLTGSDIVGVGNITSTGTIEATNVTLSGVDITEVGFSGDYNDLINTPSIPVNVSELVNDAGYLTVETDSQTLGLVGNTLSISNGNSISLTPILPTSLSEFANDVGYITNLNLESLSDLSDVETTGVTNGQALVYNSSTGEWRPGTVAAEGISELFDITGDDSTVRTVLPGSTIQIGGTGDISTASDADGNILITNNSTLDSITSRGATTSNTLTVGAISTSGLTSTSLGAATITSASTLTLDTADGVIVSGAVLRLGSLTTTERNGLGAANGDIIYNSTDNKFQGYENGSWVNLV